VPGVAEADLQAPNPANRSLWASECSSLYGDFPAGRVSSGDSRYRTVLTDDTTPSVEELRRNVRRLAVINGSGERPTTLEASAELLGLSGTAIRPAPARGR
jgi:hypothetical protein